MRKDVEYLRSRGLMDYSLLVAIEKTSPKNANKETDPLPRRNSGELILLQSADFFDKNVNKIPAQTEMVEKNSSHHTSANKSFERDEDN
jgi:hypothetical protein